MELEDFISSYAGKIEEPIGNKIIYFKYLFCEIDSSNEPVFAWMKTDDGVWHRFFMDVWVTYWEALNPLEALQYVQDANENSIEDLIKDELEEYIDSEGGKWNVLDVLKSYNLFRKEVINVQVEYKEINENIAAQLKISIEGGTEIEINDFCDKINTELIVNGNKKG